MSYGVDIFIVIVPVKGTVMQIKKTVMIAAIQKINLESFALVLFMILQLYTSVVSHLGIKYGLKYGSVLVLYLFQDISSFKSEKGVNIKLSRAGFLYKQKR